MLTFVDSSLCVKHYFFISFKPLNHPTEVSSVVISILWMKLRLSSVKSFAQCHRISKAYQSAS